MSDMTGLPPLNDIKEKNIINEKGKNSYDSINLIFRNYIPPKKTFDDIIGLEETKNLIETSFINRTKPKYSGLFKGRTPYDNFLMLFGPPGTGKTVFAESIATVSKMTFYSIESSMLISSEVGESEKKISYLFKKIKSQVADNETQESKEYKDAIKKISEFKENKKYKKYYDQYNNKSRQILLFFDEADSIAKSRKISTSYESSVLNTLLININFIKEKYSRNILVVFATNIPFSLDSAILSRITQKVYVRNPNKDERREILQLYINNRKYKLNDKGNKEVVDKNERELINDKDLNLIADITEEFSGRDLKTLSSALIQKTIERYMTSKYLKWNFEDKITYCMTLNEKGRFLNSELKEEDYDKWEDIIISSDIVEDFLPSYMKSNSKDIKTIKKDNKIFERFQNGEDADKLIKEYLKNDYNDDLMNELIKLNKKDITKEDVIKIYKEHLKRLELSNDIGNKNELSYLQRFLNLFYWK